jgi:hypothetical protein
MTERELSGWAGFAELERLAEVDPETWGRASDAAAQLAPAREATWRQRAAFRETRPDPADGLFPLEHAEIDKAIAGTAFYAALHDLEAGS